MEGDMAISDDFKKTELFKRPVSNIDEPLKLLIVEDSSIDAELIAARLSQDGFNPDWKRVDNESEYIAALKTQPELILADWSLPQFSGLRALQIIRDLKLDIPFIIVSGSISENSAIEAIRLGAYDYVLKDRPGQLVPSVRNALEEKRLREARSQSEERIRKSEEKYRSFVENSSEAIWRVEITQPVSTGLRPEDQIELLYRHGIIEECNYAMARMHDYSGIEEIIGRLLGLIFPRLSSQNVQILRLFLRDGYRITDLKSQEIDKKGRVKYFSNSWVGIVKEGFLTRIWGVKRDLTQRRIIENALEEASRENQLLLDSIGEGICGVDPEGRTTFINPAALKMTGFEPNDLLGMIQHYLMHHTRPDGSPYPIEECKIYAAYKEGKIQQVSDEVFWRKDGTSFPVEYTSTPIYAKDEINGAVVVFTDITERKKAEEAIQKSESLLHKVLDTLPVGIWIADENGIIKYGNEAGRKIWAGVKYVGIEQYGEYKGWWAGTGKKIEPDEWSMARAITRGETSRNELIEIECFDGSHKIILNSAVPLRDDRQNITGAFVVNQDVTEEKEAEKIKEKSRELQIAAQVADAANRAKSVFLTSMSHELRTPLNAIIGFSEVLKDKYYGEMNEKQLEYIRDIEISGRHLLSLINDILDLSKIEAGKMELDLSRVKIYEIVENSLIMIREKAMKHSLQVDLEISEDLKSLECAVDERKVKQILYNLLSNAAKFTPDGGRIRVMADFVRNKKNFQPEYIESDKETGNYFIEISVEDTGIGIAPDDQEKIFEEFYQVQSGLKNKTPGTGLGLPLSKRYVELHGGEISVESEGLGFGSRFIFRLPVRVPEDISRRKVFSYELDRKIDLHRNIEEILDEIIITYKTLGKIFALSCVHTTPHYLRDEAVKIIEILKNEKRDDDLVTLGKDGQIHLVMLLTNREKAETARERLIGKLEMEPMLKKLSIQLVTAFFPEDGGSSEILLKKIDAKNKVMKV